MHHFQPLCMTQITAVIFKATYRYMNKHPNRKSRCVSKWKIAIAQKKLGGRAIYHLVAFFLSVNKAAQFWIYTTEKMYLLIQNHPHAL